MQILPKGKIKCVKGNKMCKEEIKDYGGGARGIKGTRAEEGNKRCR